MHAKINMLVKLCRNKKTEEAPVNADLRSSMPSQCTEIEMSLL